MHLLLFLSAKPVCIVNIDVNEFIVTQSAHVGQPQRDDVTVRAGHLLGFGGHFGLAIDVRHQGLFSGAYFVIGPFKLVFLWKCIPYCSCSFCLQNVFVPFLFFL